MLNAVVDGSSGGGRGKEYLDAGRYILGCDGNTTKSEGIFRFAEDIACEEHLLFTVHLIVVGIVALGSS